MKKHSVTVPELMFVVATRAALAAGAALLVSGRLKPKTRKRAGAALAGIGVVSTIPAVKLLISR
jgi:hypothetical protein